MPEITDSNALKGNSSEPDKTNLSDKSTIKSKSHSNESNTESLAQSSSEAESPTELNEESQIINKQSNQSPQIDAPVKNVTDSKITSPTKSSQSQGKEHSSTESKPKKRLTLQERLALAAKGKKTGAQLTSSKENLNQQSSSGATQSLDSKDPSNLSADNNKNNNEPLGNDASKYTDKKATSNDISTEQKNLQDENKMLKDKIQKLEKELKEKERDTNSSNSTKEKIEQLMREGEALSKKELKLNETIKKLKAMNADLEQSLSDFVAKDTNSQMQLQEINDVLKVHKIGSISQLPDILKELSSFKDEAQKGKSWEIQYRQQVKISEEQINTNKELTKQIQEIKIQKDLAAKQKDLELESARNLINDLKEELATHKTDSIQETNRLKMKIEELRSQIESPKTSDKNDKDDLSVLHFQLQEQYLTSQENFKVIESSLQKKIEQLTSYLESSRASKNKLLVENKKLQGQLSKNVESSRDFEIKIEELLKENEELKFQCEQKDATRLELEEKFETFKKIYNNDRMNLNAKIEKLTEESEFEKSNISNSHISSQTLSLNLDSDENNFNKSLSDIKFGESCTTPHLSRDTSTFNLNGSNELLTTANGDELEAGTDAETFNRSRSRENSFITSYSGGFQNGNNNSSGGSNVQLINKMSSNIRRLEIELNTLRAENVELNKQKELAQQEILHLTHLEEDKIVAYERITELQKELEKSKEREQTMLEIIGEKSEQVQELKADVEDLKELMRSQVQQMVDMSK